VSIKQNRPEAIGAVSDILVFMLYHLRPGTFNHEHHKKADHKHNNAIQPFRVKQTFGENALVLHKILPHHNCHKLLITIQAF